MNPLITVVTPSYNQAQFLEQTICSVLEQETSNLEYMVVDGGSQDGSLAIIQKYAGDLAWWVSEPDKGQGHAIQKGFKRAQGDYLAWLNSDDYYLPGALDSAIKMLESHPEMGMVYGDVLAVDENGKTIRRLRYHQWDLKDLMQFNIIGQPSVVMRRSAYEQAGGISSQYHFLLDHHLWLRIAANKQIGYVTEIWSAARFHKAAKNIAHAAAFGEEASRIAAWLSEDEIFASTYSQYKKQIWAGAYRFGARYLSEGKQYRDSLAIYKKAWKSDPSVVIHDWKRVGVTLLGRLGLWK